MKTEKTRAGVVGYGWAAGAHIDALNALDDCEVAAVCSRRRLDPAALRRRHGADIRVFDDYDAMLADKGLDVISICTPHHLHTVQAVAAARAGKHVIVEKPVALCMKDLDRLRRSVTEAGVKAVVCFEGRTTGLAQVIRDVVAKGLLGDIHYAEADYYHAIGPWYGQYSWNIRKEMGGSSLLTAGCHQMHGLLWAIPSPPVEVMTYGARSRHPDFAAYEYPTTTVTIVKFENGAVGKCASVIDCLQPYENPCRLIGSKGALFNDKFYTEDIAGLDRNEWSRFATEVGRSGDVKDHPYGRLFGDFVAAIREDRPPRFDFEEALFTHKVCMAADYSREIGRPVSIAEFEGRG